MNSWRSVPQGRAYSTLRVPAPEMQKQLRGDLSCKASAQNWKGWLKPPLATDWVQFPRLRHQHSLLRSGCWTLGSDVLLDETTREPQLKRNLMENWRNAQFLCQQDLESTDPHLNYEVGCELTSWVEYPWDDGSAQWLVPCCETRDPVSGTPFILRCIKWQKKKKNKVHRKCAAVEDLKELALYWLKAMLWGGLVIQVKHLHKQQ